MKALTSAFTQSLFTFLFQSPSPALYWVPANFQNFHGCTVSDISSMQRNRGWTWFKRSVVLLSQNEHLLHALLGSCSKPNANWRTFSCSLSHTYPFPSCAAPFPLNRKTFRGLPTLALPFLFCLLLSRYKQDPLTLCFCHIKHRLLQTEVSLGTT